jgi:hypothetical protein
MLLGSAPLLVRQGLTDSLAGRFEVIRVTHWTFAEMRDAFGWDLDTYLFHGGYPGAAGLVKSHERWEEYILDSIVETNLSRDILLLNRVEKPGSSASSSAWRARARAGRLLHEDARQPHRCGEHGDPRPLPRAARWRRHGRGASEARRVRRSVGAAHPEAVGPEHRACQRDGAIEPGADADR